jgi:hypothetical protein
MVGSCLEQCVIYKATVSSSEGEKHYIGATELTFKTRFTNHKESFTNSSKSSSTTLSKHIWNLMGRGLSYTIKWEIIRRCPPYKCGTRRCDLCLSEKYFILKANSEHCLNRNFELLQKCRHSNKFKLGNFSRATSPSLREDRVEPPEEVRAEPLQEDRDEPPEEVRAEPLQEDRDEPPEEVRAELLREDRDEPPEEVRAEPLQEDRDEPPEEVRAEPLREDRDEPPEEVRAETTSPSRTE